MPKRTAEVAAQLDAQVAEWGGDKAIHSVLVANNGLAATKFMRSVRSWAYKNFGNERAGGRRRCCGCCCDGGAGGRWPGKAGGGQPAHACGWLLAGMREVACMAGSRLAWQSPGASWPTGCPRRSLLPRRPLPGPPAVNLIAMATPEDMRADAEHIRMADQFVEVPGGKNTNNYANVQLIAAMAMRTGVDAVWPGW